MTAIAMIAHCLFHQTPALDRARCPACETALRRLAGGWYCGDCCRPRVPIPCAICTTGQLDVLSSPAPSGTAV